MRSFYETMQILEAANNPMAAFAAIPQLLAKFEELVGQLEAMVQTGQGTGGASPQPQKSGGWFGSLFGRSNESVQESYDLFMKKLKVIEENSYLLSENIQQQVAQVIPQLRQIVGELKSNFEVVQDFSSMLNSALDQRFKGFQGDLTKGMQQSFKDIVRSTKPINQEEMMYNIADLTSAINTYSPSGQNNWIKIYPGIKGSRTKGATNVPYDDRDAHAALAQRAVKLGNALWRLQINKPSASSEDVFEVDMTDKYSVQDAISWIQTTAARRYSSYLKRQKARQQGESGV